MRRPAARIALLGLLAAACWVAATATGAGQAGQFPACPPGSPALPPPTRTATGDPGSPERIVAGRPFTIEYDSSQVAVQDTAGPPGTTFASNDATGGLIAPTVPTAGPAVFTVRYYALSATAATACAQSASFTVDVGPGDLLAPRIGYSEGPTIKLIGRFARLPRRGDLTGGAPVAGLLFPCSATTARVPLLAELRVERNLRRKPSAASPLTTLALPDPCGPKPSAAAAPGARLRHANIFDSSWTVAAEHRFTGGARYWLRITQAGRLLGELRYYVAFRPAATRFSAVWVIAPDAAFERARCTRLRRGDPTNPLGFRKFPIPPAPASVAAMGREIERERFGGAEYERFSERLGESLAALGELLERPGFGEGPATLGAELELALVDSAGRPAGENAAVQEALGGEDDVALEVGRFCIETATAPVPLAGRPFTALSERLSESVGRIAAAAAVHGARVAMIGTLPTLTMGDLGPGGLTASPRYRALSAALEPMKPDRRLIIDGPETLDVEMPGIVAEAANAAFQIHLRVAPADFARTFNAAQLATAPALAAAANSPTFLGKVLWDETRVPLFHQAIDGHQGGEEVWRPSRVAFGHGWVRHGALELLQESVALHEVVLPLHEPEDPLQVVRAGGVPELAELRLHHGTTWRWNRAIYDPAGGGHLRIELRALPAGPSVIDMTANAAFLIGATLGLAAEEWMIPAIPFTLVRRNFYRAARDGLDAELLWPAPRAPSPRPMPAAEVADRLIPVARRGLAAAGVDPEDTGPLLDLMAERVTAEVNGASWQRAALSTHEERMMRGTALAATLDAYIEAQFSGLPVHRWPMPSRPGSRAAA